MRKKGFTLIELLVVIAIIGLLATLAIVALKSAQVSARDTRRVSDVRSAAIALELYFNTNNSYPVVTLPLVLGTVGTSNTLSDGGFAGTVTKNTYMGTVPANIAPGGSDYTYTSLQEDGTTACTSGQCPKYSITFSLEKAMATIGTGTNCKLTQDTLICS